MADVKPGQIMEVLATDTGTQKDLPAWSKKMGHEYLGFVDEPGYMRLFVKTGQVAATRLGTGRPEICGTPRFSPNILVFSTHTISDPGIDLAGSSHMHYSPRVKVISVPARVGSSPVLGAVCDPAGLRRCLHRLRRRGVRLPTRLRGAHGEDRGDAQSLLKERGYEPRRVRMAAICSVCAEPFTNYMHEFAGALAEMGPALAVAS